MKARSSRLLLIIVTALTMALGTACDSDSGGGYGGGGAGPAYDPDAAAAAQDAGADAAIEAADERDAELREAYSDGFHRGCDEAFEQSPSGDLYYGGEQYTVDDCYGLEDDDAALDYDSPGVADDAGHNDAVAKTFEELPPSGELCYGSDCYDGSDIRESDGDSDYSYGEEDEPVEDGGDYDYGQP